MTDETDTTGEVARVLLAHDAERMECMDHDRLCCPTCDAHDFADAYKHQADALADAGLLREAADSAEPCTSEVWSMDYYRDGQVDPYWIRCNALGPHVEHEDANTGLTWTTDDPEEAQIATQEPAGAPGVDSAGRGASRGLDGAAWPFAPGDVVQDSGEGSDHAAWLDAAPQRTVVVDHQGTEWVRLGDGWFLSDPPVRASRWASANLEQTYGPLSVVSVGTGAP